MEISAIVYSDNFDKQTFERFFYSCQKTVPQCGISFDKETTIMISDIEIKS